MKIDERLMMMMMKARSFSSQMEQSSFTKCEHFIYFYALEGVGGYMYVIHNVYTYY